MKFYLLNLYQCTKLIGDLKMSRTYRKYPSGIKMEKLGRCHRYCFLSFTRKKNRDRKPWGKTPKVMKKIWGKQRKSKERQVMRRGEYENIPFFKKENDWMWT